MNPIRPSAFALFIHLLLLTAASGQASAALRYSLASDFSNAVPLEGAVVPAGQIFVGNEVSQSLSSLECCTWIRGPGAGILRNGSSLSDNGSGLVPVDLSSLPAGSVRRASSGIHSAIFTVTYAKDFQPVALTSSGPINVTLDGAVIENMHITSGTGDDCAVRIHNVNNVTLRNLDISHANVGICVQDSFGLRIEGVRLDSNSATAAGPHCVHSVSGCKNDTSLQASPDTRLAIKLNRAVGTHVERVETHKASSGVFTYESPNTDINDIACYDMRGPFPRGQCVQFVYSDDSSLTNFYSKAWKDQSHSEDNINMYESDRVVVQEGLVDGNFSINGVGVIADAGSDDGIVRNVDLMHTAVSAVSVYSNGEVGRNFLAENIRVKDTTCSSRDGGTPSSDGLVLAAHPQAWNVRFLNVQYYNHCRSLTKWCDPNSSCSQGSTGTIQLREENFTPREPLELQFAWDAPQPSAAQPSVECIIL